MQAITTAQLQAIIAEGKRTGEASRPMPMKVYSNGRLIDYVEDGACGFAWVNVKGLRGNIRKEFEAVGFSQSDYDKAMQLWIGEFNQSYDRKRACASRIAELLREQGYKAIAGGRLD